MKTTNIIYYSRQDDKNKTLSLRDLCLREEYDKGLETVFYAIHDALDTQELLVSLKRLCHESIELFEENDRYVVFEIMDAYDRINYLKIKKQGESNK